MVVLPFDKYRIVGIDAEAVRQAKLRLAARCLERRGVGVTIPSDAFGDVLREGGINERRYGVILREDALAAGYHMPPDEPFRAHYARRAVWERSLSDRQSTALQACSDRAAQRLRADVVHADGGWFTGQDFDSLTWTRRSTAGKQVKRAWSDCMRVAGYSYRSPEAAIADNRWNLDGKVTSAEVRTAVADVACKHETAYVQRMEAVETQHQLDLIARYSVRFGGIEAARTAYMANVRRSVA